LLAIPPTAAKRNEIKEATSSQLVTALILVDLPLDNSVTNSHTPGVSIDADLLGLTDIARLAGVGRTVVANWRTRHSDFPPPADSRAAGPVFRRDEVQEWLQKHRPEKATIEPLSVEAELWKVADGLRANSHLKSAEYSIPVLGLIFLKFADRRFADVEAELKGKATGRRVPGKVDYQSRGVLFLPEHARFANLLRLPEGANLGKAINDAMAAIEEENDQLKGVLPRTYQAFSNATLVSLLRSVNSILGGIPGDAFGRVYEYFLGKFAIAEARKVASTSRPPRSFA